MQLEKVLCRPSATPLFERQPSPPRIHVNTRQSAEPLQRDVENVTMGNKAYIAASLSPVMVRRSLKACVAAHQPAAILMTRTNWAVNPALGGRTLKSSERNLDAKDTDFAANWIEPSRSGRSGSAPLPFLISRAPRSVSFRRSWLRFLGASATRTEQPKLQPSPLPSRVLKRCFCFGAAQKMKDLHTTHARECRLAATSRAAPNCLIREEPLLNVARPRRRRLRSWLAGGEGKLGYCQRS